MGDAGLHNPEDLLVASLSTCHMLWYLHLAADAGLHVSGYVDDPEGVLEMVDGQMLFTSVVLRPGVSLAKGEPQEALAIHREASAACFIANSVNFPVTHEPRIV
ncbi:MAG: OsmC family protein [Geminicoccales bacterium]